VITHLEHLESRGKLNNQLLEAVETTPQSVVAYRAGQKSKLLILREYFDKTEKIEGT